MTQPQTETPSPDDVADEQSRRQSEERQAVADGDTAAQPDREDGDLDAEAAYTTEGEQGAAQPAPR